MSFHELAESCLSSTDKMQLQRKYDKYDDSVTRQEIINYVQEKSELLEARLEACVAQFVLLKSDGTKECDWFLSKLESWLQSAESDFVDENCDDYDMGLKILREYLETRYPLPKLSAKLLSTGKYDE